MSRKNVFGVKNDLIFSNTSRQRVDNETLAFDTAVAALGFRLNCEEHEYPMLSESIRRQKSDLSFTLIMR
jgi:hypothetical protein